MKRRKARGRRGIESAHIEGLAEPFTSQTRSESEGGGESGGGSGRRRRKAEAEGAAPADPRGRWDRLEAWARERVPSLGATVARWSGQVMEPADGLGFIGHNPSDAPGVFIATGDSGHGLTHGTLAASMLVQLIAGEDHRYAALYDPRRVCARSLPAFARENLATAGHYIDWLRPSDVLSEDLIARGEGATMLERGHRLAVFRDEAGTCHRFSAACPHLGGVVHWNAAEKSWDCPCHGSRFDSTGRVVAGPSAFDLRPAVDDDGDDVITLSEPKPQHASAP